MCGVLVSNGIKASELKNSQDVYAKVVDLAQDEARRNFDRLSKNPNAPYFSLNSPWLAFLKRNGVTIPFIFDDLNSKKHNDIKLLRKIAANRDNIKDLASLQAFITSQTGLGIKYKHPSTNKTPHALDAVESGAGNCLELIYLYYGIGLLLGLEMEVQDWDFEREKHAHIVVRSGTDIMNPAGSPPQQKPKVVALNRLELLAYYHYNRAVGSFCKSDDLDRELECGEKEMLPATRYAPNNFRITQALNYLANPKRPFQKHSSP